MELVLALVEETCLRVTCDDHASHTADLRPLLVLEEQEAAKSMVDDPVAYGENIYAALFPLNTLAQQTLASMPERLLLVAPEPLLDAIAWEYAYGPFGADDPTDTFLVLECRVVRGLPASQRIAPPPQDQSLHIVAIPSNPLSDRLEPLAIEAEWIRLKEIVQQVPSALTLERAIPPTVERVRQLVVNQKECIIHFMGHGGQDTQQGAMLCFEQDNGALHLVTAKKFVQRVRGTTFLVTLNACVSATPGPTSFHNLAASLVRQKTPYALGMRLSIVDEDACTFSRIFYNELARGSAVEEALFQARLTLAQSQRAWVVGVPVLYTALREPAPGIVCQDGTPTIKDTHPPVDVSTLPSVEGTFQGRIHELIALGTNLTGDQRPRLLTILGTGGQGKTALALKTIERVAFAWPGGIWATALDTLPTRSTFVIALAQFLGIETQETLDLSLIERKIVARLNERRTLLLLDNAETLVEAVEAKNMDALDLVAFLKKLRGTSASLLVTSRVPLGWDDEQTYELGGLAPAEGAALFQQCAPQRRREIDLTLAASLSRQLEGHPLGLRLLAGAFNERGISLSAFLKVAEEQLREAEDKYVGPDHRHRTLYACIEISVRSLDPALRALLSGLWIFRAPFLAETAAAIFDPDTQETEQQASEIRDHLHHLWLRSLLTRKMVTAHDGTWQFYALLPTTRPYIEHRMEQMHDRGLLRKRFVTAYSRIARYAYDEVDRSTILAQQMREDLERLCEALGQEEMAERNKSSYLSYWGWVVYRLGNSVQGLSLLERALELVQEADSHLMLLISNNMALVYRSTGRPQEALRLFEHTLPIRREVGDRAGEATTLNNMAEVYQNTGNPQEALRLYELALPIMCEVGDRAGEAATLNNMAEVYRSTGRLKDALQLYKQILPITREVSHRRGEASTLNNMALAYSAMGSSQEALQLYEQALPITREMGNRDLEATILNNMAGVYQATGHLQEALRLFEHALPIRREVGDRAGEATTLNNIALVYQDIGHLQEALRLFEQALPIMCEVGDRAGEATTLNNIARVYQDTGRLQEALQLFKQALLIMREVGDRNGEAATLNNIALVYQATGHPEEALCLFEQALLIMREVGDRNGEATTLNNMAVVYQGTGRLQEALQLFKQVLPIMREVGERAGEATTLNNIALVYQDTGRLQEALQLFEQALPIMREVGNLASEILSLVNLASLLYNHFNQSADAITLLEQALEIFAATGLPQDAAGQTVEQVRQFLRRIQDGITSNRPSTLPSETIQQIVSRTVVVMTIDPSHLPEWHKQIIHDLQDAQQRGANWQIEVDFFTAVLAILDGQSPTLSPDHPYARAIEAIQKGIATTKGETI